MKVQFVEVYSTKHADQGRIFFTDEYKARFFAQSQDVKRIVRRDLVECLVVNDEPVIPQHIDTAPAEQWMVDWLNVWRPKH